MSQIHTKLDADSGTVCRLQISHNAGLERFVLGVCNQAFLEHFLRLFESRRCAITA